MSVLFISSCDEFYLVSTGLSESASLRLIGSVFSHIPREIVLFYSLHLTTVKETSYITLVNYFSRFSGVQH